MEQHDNKSFIDSIAGIPSSGILLVAANLVPAFGVIFFGWNIFNILFLYWAESAIIGFFNILKMLTLREKGGLPTFIVLMIEKIFMIGFFIVHFGGFMFVHGLFLLMITQDYSKTPIDPVNLLRLSWFALFFLFVSHGYSFVTNFYLGGERDQASIDVLFTQPYARIIIMQFTIIFGMLFSLIFGQPIWLILIFVAMKIAVDLFSHSKERKKFSRTYQKDSRS